MSTRRAFSFGRIVFLAGASSYSNFFICSRLRTRANLEFSAGTTSHDLSLVFIELGVAVVGLAFLTRMASRFGFSTIPLYLLAGLAFGNGGFLPLRFSENIVHVGGEVGVLLFMLGWETSGNQL